MWMVPVQGMALPLPVLRTVPDRLFHEGGFLARRAFPADDHTGEGVDDEGRAAEPAGCHRDLREIGEGDQGRGLRSELAVE